MSTTNVPSEQRVVMGNVSWSIYVALVESAENPRGRLAYDQGVLEVMSPSMLHESLAKLIGRMIETWSLEMNVEILSAKSTTLLRPDLEKGVEADECYYIGSVDAVRGLKDIDLTIHPPPDLVIEIDISRLSRIKLPIYAALGVAEVWRYDGEAIHVLALDSGRLVEVPGSRVLPRFPLHEAIRLAALRDTMGETALIRSFRDFIQTIIQADPSAH